MDETSTRRAAHEDLQYIRRTLAAAGHISTVPGKGLVMIGILALMALWFDQRLTAGAVWERVAYDDDFGPIVIWKATWLVLLVTCLVVGVLSMRAKAKRTGQVFWSPVLRKALWGYGAAMTLGGLLTWTVLRSEQTHLLPELWLGCYGVALISAGGYSVSPVRWMGLCFLATAAGAAVTTPSLGPTWLALGFGWVHIAFGAYIAWRHDG